MRKFIDIIRESRDDSFYHDVIDTLQEHGGSADEDEIDSVRRQLSKRTNGSPLVLYRFMRLDIDEINDIEGGERLGQHWTTNPEMPTDNLYDGGPDHGPMLVFVVHASPIDIAEAHTVAFNILFPEEDEVFLLPRAELILQGIYQQGSEVNLRPDLIGRNFGV